MTKQETPPTRKQALADVDYLDRNLRNLPCFPLSLLHEIWPRLAHLRRYIKGD